MNVKQLIDTNKVSKPVVNKYEYIGNDINLLPSNIGFNINSFKYDKYNLIDGYRYILFDTKSKLCYIFEARDYEVLKDNIHIIRTGQTKV